jgi:deoxyribonuclease-4
VQQDPAGPRYIGPHAALGGGMVKAADRAGQIGATAIQVFGDNPTAWRRREDPPVESAAFRQRLREHGIGPVAIHAAYLVNLAGPEPDFFERSVAVLTADMRGASAFDGRFVNVHIGSHRDTSLEAGIDRVAEGIRRVLGEVEDGPDGPQLVLENAAGSGWAVGVTIEELALLAEAIDARGIPGHRVGFCLDTAHLWGAGYAICDPAAVDALLDDFEARIGLERLSMIHLNDSKAPLGSRQDRHEHIGAGQIGPAGLGHLLREPRLARVPFYLETPGMDLGYDAINLTRALRLAAGRELAPLPAEAFALKGSRSRVAHPADPGAEGGAA